MGLAISLGLKTPGLGEETICYWNCRNRCKHGDRYDWKPLRHHSSSTLNIDGFKMPSIVRIKAWESKHHRISAIREVTWSNAAI